MTGPVATRLAVGLVALGLLGACVAGPAAAPPAARMAEPLRITNGTAPFASFEGARARKMAEAACESRGQRLQSSIYDRYEAGAWVFVEGCA